MAFSAPTSDLDPLIITSPTGRSGTTLLQRLLCSSSTALIFGELCAQDLDLLLNLYTLKAQQYTFEAARYTRSLHDVLAGDVDDWIVYLMPDVGEYVTALGRAAFAGIEYCRAYAHRVGRPVWGLKYPGWQPASLRLLRAVLPRARLIFIYRDIVACARSKKAQLELRTSQELEDFCRAWVGGIEYMSSLEADPAVLVLRYEDLVAEPERALAQLADFTGLRDIRRETLARRINSREGVLPQSAKGYVAPAELTDAELRTVHAITAAQRARLYRQPLLIKESRNGTELETTRMG